MKEARPLARPRTKTLVPAPVKTFGPVSDLERHLPSDWWRTLFNSLYLKTDGDVVENAENTRRDVDFIVQVAGLAKEESILDLCCGQGRHAIELARRGYDRVVGIDRSRYLIRLARKRAKEENLHITFHEGDARRFRTRKRLFDCVMLLGNSFGYFEHQAEDEAVLGSVSKVLADNGRLVLDIVDGAWMKEHFEKRSWEWIDENHFVCRERALARDGRRVVTREVITHSERGVLADQFYAERLYMREELEKLLEKLGFRSVQFHDVVESDSTRGQDLGMMARRMVFTAQAPIRVEKPALAVPVGVKKVTVLMGDPALPDRVKLAGQFNQEDFQTVDRMKAAFQEVSGYRFKYYDNHRKMMLSFLADPPSFVLNLCDEGFMNDPFMEGHVASFLEMLGVPYSGAGPACLGLCYNKSLVRSIAETLDVPVPLESYLAADDNAATLPSTFPALLKPNFGDSSMGITKDAVVFDADQLLNYVDWMRNTFGPCSILIQEYLSGPEYSVGIIGNPGQRYRILPPLEVDYSRLDPELPPILGYESKWNPQSPYWTQIQYKEAELDEETARKLPDFANALFARTGCRDYARFDFRTDAEGTIKLLEVNPNPGWCWDGKMNIMAGFGGLSYSEMLEMILKAAEERLGVG